jgi:ABC-type Fe3+-hydroxamate transport system substrate-binding protein
MRRILTDQMNRQVEIPLLPKRIVSLVPSQTELLYDLGLTNEVVGQTLFCIHPEGMHQVKPRVGGTKKYKFDVIDQLQPDLIIGNKEENEQGGIELLAQKYPVWMSDIHNLDDALDMINRVGELVDKKEKASEIITNIRESFLKFVVKDSNLRVAYFIWRNPWMAAGHDTFINDMLGRCGLLNVFANETSRYPEATNEQIAAANPELILLSSEPYPFKEQHIAELKELCPAARIMLVDGELFSWYGSRLIKSAAYFQSIISSIRIGLPKNK